MRWKHHDGELAVGGALGGGGGARALVCEARVGPLTHTPAGPPCSRASGAVTGAATPRCAISMARSLREKKLSVRLEGGGEAGWAEVVTLFREHAGTLAQTLDEEGENMVEVSGGEGTCGRTYRREPFQTWYPGGTERRMGMVKGVRKEVSHAISGLEPRPTHL